MHGWASDRGAAFEDVGSWKRAWYFSRAGESMHDSVARECRTARACIGLFDASTLGKIEVVGPDAAAFLERMYANSFCKLEPGRCRYAERGRLSDG
jgi:sarcosine oxidase subunit alpha